MKILLAKLYIFWILCFFHHEIINFVRMNTEQDIQLLISAIENAEGISKITSKKFEHLSQRIFMRTRERIGVTTLKRLWGYVNDTTTPRAVTLDILSQYIGYRSFDDFKRLYNADDVNGAPSSNITFGDCVYADDMEVGDVYRLTWSPNRVCIIEYRGDYTFLKVRFLAKPKRINSLWSFGLTKSFIVKSSQSTKLIDGTTFRCQVIEKGEQLFLDHVYFDANQRSPLNYIAGKIGGVNYEKL